MHGLNLIHGNGDNRLIVTDEPVEFEKLPVEVQDVKKTTGHFRGIYTKFHKIVNQNPTDVIM